MLRLDGVRVLMSVLRLVLLLLVGYGWFISVLALSALVGSCGVLMLLLILVLLLLMLLLL